MNDTNSKKTEYVSSDDKKEGKWFLREIEDRFRNKIVPHIPKCIETYHLTYMTIVWSVSIVIFGWFAKENINWMWLVSLMIFLQYITDLFDGAIGRYRNTGLIKWGYYMDHFLDYLFLVSVIAAYYLLFPANFGLLFIGILVFAIAPLVSVFLASSVSDKMNISFMNFGPTEGRLLLIFLNTLLIIFGVNLAQKVLPYIFIGEIILISLMVYKTQKQLWKVDMAIKNQKVS